MTTNLNQQFYLTPKFKFYFCLLIEYSFMNQDINDHMDTAFQNNPIYMSIYSFLSTSTSHVNESDPNEKGLDICFPSLKDLLFTNHFSFRMHANAITIKPTRRHPKEIPIAKPRWNLVCCFPSTMCGFTTIEHEYDTPLNAIGNLVRSLYMHIVRLL